MTCTRKIGLDSTGRPRRPNTVPVKERLVCRGCGATWNNDGRVLHTKCPHCGKPKDARDRRAYNASLPDAKERLAKMVAWRKANGKGKNKTDETLLKKRVFFAVSGATNAVCVRCGCSDWRLLEVNHKNGGGKREHETGRHARAFYHDVIQGRRRTDDLEILCRPYNALHYLETKFGALPMRVIWEGK